MHVRPGAGHDAGGEGARVELVLRVQDQRGVHRPVPLGAAGLAVQQVQEMRADAVVVGLGLDAAAVLRPVKPVQQHGAEARHKPVGDVAGAGLVVVLLFRQGAAKGTDRRAHHVHRVRCGRQRFQHLTHAGRDAAQRLELGLVGAQFRRVGQPAINQQVGDLLELAGFGHVQDVVAAVVQVVAGAAHGAQRGVPRDDA